MTKRKRLEHCAINIEPLYAKDNCDLIRKLLQESTIISVTLGAGAEMRLSYPEGWTDLVIPFTCALIVNRRGSANDQI